MYEQNAGNFVAMEPVILKRDKRGKVVMGSARSTK